MMKTRTRNALGVGLLACASLGVALGGVADQARPAADQRDRRVPGALEVHEDRERDEVPVGQARGGRVAGLHSPIDRHR